jgi:predicted metal-binding membrane protein
MRFATVPAGDALRASDREIFAVAALLFAASAAATIIGCRAMPAMGGMPMQGGWTMSMAWLPICGQTWLGSATSFLGMWVVMMVAMMLPSLVPRLWRYRRAVGRAGGMRLGLLTGLVGAAYFSVWTGVGLAAFSLRAGFAEFAMSLEGSAPAVPVAVGAVVVMAGAVQFSAWKARQLACCREASGCGYTLPADAVTAWRHGLQLGIQCSLCCGGLTAVLLVTGVMDLRVMVAVTVAINSERLLPGGERVAHAIGAVVVGVGLAQIARAAGVG